MAGSDQHCGVADVPAGQPKSQPKMYRKPIRGPIVGALVDRLEDLSLAKAESMSGSSTALMEPAEEALPSSQLLGSSMSSLSSRRKVKSQISKIYKEVSALYLTRQLSEALSTIEPLVTPPKPLGEITEDEGTPRMAPVATASRKHRIGVWVLYLTLLKEISELPSEDGKAALGNKAWSDLFGKAQDGTIWEEVVGIGYGGMDGNVDAEVVASLATLLLAQSISQKSTQQHLESYLSTSNSSKLGVEDPFHVSGISLGHITSKTDHDETDTLRELKALVRIIELFTLEVLPRNGEWDYARDFITRSEVLDEDAREGLLQNFEGFETEQSQCEERFENTPGHQEDLTEREPHPVRETETQGPYTSYVEQPLGHHRSNSEKDYGIDNVQSPSHIPNSKALPPQRNAKPNKAPQVKPSRSPTTKAPREPGSTSVYKRSVAAVSALQNIASKLAEQVSRNPMGLLRFLLFLMGLIMAFSRRDIKDRLGRLTGPGWDKVKKTVGMGVKVSYI